MASHKPPQSRSVVLLVTMTVGLTGCSGMSDEPVPTVAEAPFVCDGVPLRGMELMAGSTDLVYDRDVMDTWGRDGLFCSVGQQRAFNSSVSVSHTKHLGDGTPEQQIERFRSAGGVPIVADAPGAGFVVRSADEAVWVCPDGFRTTVSVYDPPEDRDTAADVERYLVSILPWMCGETLAPERTVELPDGVFVE